MSIVSQGLRLVVYGNKSGCHTSQCTFTLAMNLLSCQFRARAHTHTHRI